MTSVKSRLGEPEHLVIGDSSNEAWYVDTGRHVARVLFLCPPGLGYGLWVFVWPIDYYLGVHYRGVVIRYDPGSGYVFDARSLSVEECMRFGG